MDAASREKRFYEIRASLLESGVLMYFHTAAGGLVCCTSAAAYKTPVVFTKLPRRREGNVGMSSFGWYRVLDADRDCCGA